MPRCRELETNATIDDRTQWRLRRGLMRGAVMASGKAVRAGLRPGKCAPTRVVRFFRADGVDGVEAARTTSSAVAAAARVHDGHVFFWMEQGDAEVFLRRAHHRISPGSTHYIAPGDLAAEQNNGSMTTRSCALSVDSSALSPLPQHGADHSQMFLENAELCFRARELFGALERGAPKAEQRLRLAELGTSWRNHSTTRPATLWERRAVREVRAFIQEHASETILLEELAEVAGLSKFYLLRLFRASVGVPPHTYQVCLRLARAKALLNTKRPLAQVAADAGFSDESHLIRHWRRAYGGTPGAYARGQS